MEQTPMQPAAAAARTISSSTASTQARSRETDQQLTNLQEKRAHLVHRETTNADNMQRPMQD